uniref:Uncharacterized protein n=1 Tax=Cucumis melo TaxID=3656 RepID=A0A9I9E8C7_CUCME
MGDVVTVGCNVFEELVAEAAGTKRVYMLYQCILTKANLNKITHQGYAQLPRLPGSGAFEDLVAFAFNRINVGSSCHYQKIHSISGSNRCLTDYSGTKDLFTRSSVERLAMNTSQAME